MRSLINRSKACRDSGVDHHEQERDPRAGRYVEDLKQRCAVSHWNLLEVDFTSGQNKSKQKDKRCCDRPSSSSTT